MTVSFPSPRSLRKLVKTSSANYPKSPRRLENGRLALVEPDDPRYLYAESYRNLRSAILFMPVNGEHRPKVILITSAMPNEGKSTIVANLARTLAMGGARVVLLDCDLRRGLPA